MSGTWDGGGALWRTLKLAVYQNQFWSHVKAPGVEAGAAGLTVDLSALI